MVILKKLRTREKQKIEIEHLQNVIPNDDETLVKANSICISVMQFNHYDGV